MTHNRQLTFAYRPEGVPTRDVFKEIISPIASISDGQILCRNLLLSVDPYLRLKMYDRRSYTPPLQIGEQIPGRNVAQVVDSRSAEFAAGDMVVISGGWQEYSVVQAAGAQEIDTAIAPQEAWLGALGMTGRTAYTGLLDIGKPKAGETLVVSGAAGAVGSLVGQIGKIHGCRVVGIAGTEEKCTTVVNEFGFDACLTYRADDFVKQLADALPAGCDVYFDNVGGAVSRAVSIHYNDFARVALCGLISQYSGQQAADPTAFDEFLRLTLTRRLTVRGFIVSDFAGQYRDFEQDMAGWLADGRLKTRDYLHGGFDQIVPAFLGMLAGENIGKTLVRIADAQ